MRAESTPEVPEDAVRAGAPAPVVNLSGYRVVAVDDPEALRDALEDGLGASGVRGTVLVAPEGVNVAIAGTADQVARARRALDADPRLAGLALKASPSGVPPFARLKVRVRPEIIAFDGTSLAGTERAPAVSPATLARWLDGERADVRLLDTRNAYEVETGAFRGALSLGIDHFREFAGAVEAALADGTLELDAPLVTYCTGGVRCEKAAPWLLERGFSEVWQLDGGILDWLAARGAERFEGDCFVFDGRGSVDAALRPTGASLCPACGAAVRPGARCARGHPPPAGGSSGDGDTAPG